MQSKADLGLQLLEAASSGDRQTVAQLLDDGADPNFRDIFDRTTALHRAAERGDSQMISLLVDRGAGVLASDTDTGSSPLGVAVIAGQIEAARLLLAKRARLSADELATGLLDEARSLGYGEIVDAIQESQP